MTGCPSEDELVRMVEGALDDASLAAIESHVDHCERCAAVIAGLGALVAAGPGSGRPRARGALAVGSGSAGDAGDAGGAGGAAAGRAVGRYQLDRRIAAGGMGEVWAAWDPQLRREIAVKLVRPDRADDGRERERLLREARALARLGHPNVLAVHDVGELDGEVFIATELVAGETLASRGGPSASWRDLVKLYVQAARGLAAAHAAGLVHRDVKPSNLLLGVDGRVRVADFGLAVRSSSPSPVAATDRGGDEVPVSITATGFIAGTPAYMAPEQRAGRPPDARADQYALCVSLVEALDGRRPPLELDRDALIGFLAERRPREPELDALCGVLARGLSIDPRERFPDAGALADALERIAAGAGAGAGSMRELESAATLAAPTPSTPLPRPPPPSSSGSRPPSSSSGPHAPPPASGSHPPSSSSGPHAPPPASGPHAPPPAAGSHPPSSRPLSHATVSPDSRSRPTVAARPGPRRRRLASIAIASLAAAAGVAAVLVVARFALRSPRRPAAAVAVGSAAPAAPPRAEPIDPIGPGSAAPPPAPPIADGSGAPQVFAEGSGRTPGRPAGAPLDTPRAPAKTVAVAPPASAGGPYADLSSFLIDVQKHLRLHDARACRKLIAALPGNVTPGARFSVESFAAFCDMMAGDCAGGAARLGKAYTAQGVAMQLALYTDQYCPIEGNLETRLARLRTQVGAHTMGPAMDLSWCDALIPPARKAAGEVSTGPQRGAITFALQQLAKCIGSAGRCDEARGLWSLSLTVDESSKWRTPDLGAPCAAQAAALTSTETYADPSALLQSLTNTIRMHDVPGCQKLVASAPANVSPGHKHSLELVHAHCEMMSGDCAAGTARLGKLEPNGPGGSPVDPAIKAAWVRSNVDTYCPITGDLDARLARLWSQVDAFTSRTGGGLVAWCDALAAPAKTIAGEVSTAAQQKRAVMSLQRLASCMGGAGRCAEGRELWSLSVQLDPSAPSTPALGARCP